MFSHPLLFAYTRHHIWLPWLISGPGKAPALFSGRSGSPGYSSLANNGNPVPNRLLNQKGDLT
jgi:hypothetical protein